MHEGLATVDAVEQASLVRKRELQPIELVEAAIARIERLNPKLNAVVTPMFAQARAQALSPDLADGAFRGVPILLKDFFLHTAGDPYFCGARFLRDLDWREPSDTHLATRLRAAGFIFVGKTNLPEFAAGPITEPLAFGATRNPWDLERTPGGSSGGSAAAVAAGLVALAHANDGGGSIRIPASACGLVGLKPSRGRVSGGPGRSGGLMGQVAEGVLTRSVRDAAAALDAIAGALPDDRFVAPPPARPYLQEAGAAQARLRIGILAHDPILGAAVHPDCAEAVRMTGRALEAAGHAIEESFPAALSGPTGLGPKYFGALSASWAASNLDAWSERIGRAVTPDDVEPATWESAQRGREVSGAQVQAAVERLSAGVCRAPEWWAGGFDLLLMPVMAQPPTKIGEFTHAPDRANAAERLTRAVGLLCVPWSFSGQPALSLPVHCTADGLPIGVQLVAGYGREDLLIRVAAHLEQALAWRDRVPRVHA